MDLSVMLTYRCPSRCSTCHVWQQPSLQEEEVSLDTLAKLPRGFRWINLTGGEPTQRKDLGEIVDLLRPKTRILQITANGLESETLERIVRKHPRIRIRISADGIGPRSDRIRGEPDGFRHKQATLKRLQAAGARDLGIAVTVLDENCDQLMELFHLCEAAGLRMDTAALHNGFQFHKTDNELTNRVRLARSLPPLMEAQLRSRHPENWFRAALNLELMKKILGQPRSAPCRAAQDFLFLDPWGVVYACNVRADLEIGDLTRQSWRSILHGPAALAARTQIAHCTQNCRMAGMTQEIRRKQGFGRILGRMLRSRIGLPMDVDRVINFSDVAHSSVAAPRTSWLDKEFQPIPQKKSEKPYGAYHNAVNR